MTALPANSVGTAQLKNDAVTSTKIKDGNLTAEDIASDGIGSSRTMTSSGSKVLTGCAQIRCQREPEVGNLSVSDAQIEAVRIVAPKNTVFPLN